MLRSYFQSSAHMIDNQLACVFSRAAIGGGVFTLMEQVQDFTPTPMTVATEAWYSGFHPYTLEPVFSAKTQREKLAQRQFFFWYKPEERKNILNELRRIGRQDLIDKLYGKRNK